MRHLTDRELIADIRHTYVDDHLMQEVADRLEKLLDKAPNPLYDVDKENVVWDLQGVSDKIRDALDSCVEMELKIKELIK